MRIVGVVVSGIEVATDTLQAQFFLVVVVVEVSCYTVITYTFGVYVNVTGLARLIVDNFLCVFEFTLAIPINILFVFGYLRPYILYTCRNLGFCVLNSSLWRKVTGCTVGFYATLAIVMY